MLAITVIVTPFQIKKIISQEVVFYSGKFNPFLNFSIHFQEILILIAFIAFFVDIILNKKKLNLGNPLIAIFILSFIVLAQISLISSSKIPLISLFGVLELIIFFLFYILLIQKYLKISEVINLIIFTALFQSLLAILQFQFQKSLSLGLLGEPFLSPTQSGIAKIIQNGHAYIRGYGTYQHPNILAGLLIVSSLLTSYLFFYKKNFFMILIWLFQFLGILATFSRSAILSLILVSIFLMVLHLKKKLINKKTALFVSIILSIILLFSLMIVTFSTQFKDIFSQKSVKERIAQNRVALSIIEKNPFGVGYQNYLSALDNYQSEQPLSPWDLQPVHNLFLLFISELGIHAVILFLILLFFISKAILNQYHYFQNQKKLLYQNTIIAILASIFVIIQFDHYFYTSFQAKLLLIIVLFLVNDIFVKDNAKKVLNKLAR